MDLNKYMHPRNIYKNNSPDFKQLSESYEDFKPFVKTARNGKAFVDFRNPATVKTLSKCLLQKDFKLEVNLPSDRLAPTIPLRMNYLLWVEDLFSAVRSQPTDEIQKIIDIGAGSSCVYAMMGCRMNSHWRFLATEIDGKNFANAKANVSQNCLTTSITVIKVESSERSLLKHLFRSDDSTSGGLRFQYGCCICNPPFFASTSEKDGKIGPIANSSCQGDDVETVTEGGDLAFGKKLLEESKELRDKLIWFTIMFGKKSSFAALKKQISQQDDLLFTSYDFCQGKTVRWGLAWTHHPRLIDSVKLPQSPLKTSAASEKRVKPITFLSKQAMALGTALERLINTLEVLKVTVVSTVVIDEMTSLELSAHKCTWVNVRQKARKRKLQGDVIGDLEENAGGADAILQCSATLSQAESGNIVYSFQTQNPSQKTILNSLVVHLKRSLFPSQL